VGARVHRRLSYHPCEAHDTDRDARAHPFRTVPRVADRSAPILLRSLAGLLILAGSALKAVTFGLWTAGLGGATGVQAASTLGGAALLVGAGLLLVRVTRGREHNCSGVSGAG